MKKKLLEDEEKNLMDSYDRGEWRSVKNPKQEVKKLREYARNTPQDVLLCALAGGLCGFKGRHDLGQRHHVAVLHVDVE